MDLVSSAGRRGGTRGGKDQFKWDDVKNDKHRENYLGHSLHAPVGRWQEGKDLLWYTKGDATAEEKKRKRREEIALVKQREAQMVNRTLRGMSTTDAVKETLREELERDGEKGEAEKVAESQNVEKRSQETTEERKKRKEQKKMKKQMKKEKRRREREQKRQERRKVENEWSNSSDEERGTRRKYARRGS